MLNFFGLRQSIFLAVSVVAIASPTTSQVLEPATSPVPSPAAGAQPNGFASEGDSISASWGGNYTGIYANRRPGVRHCGLAAGGTIESLSQRASGVFACNPAVLTVLIGANGLKDEPSTRVFLNKLFAYTDSFRVKGIKVAVATILPQYHANNFAYDAIFNKRRLAANAAIRGAVGSHLDAVIDFAADPTMGPDAAAQDLKLYKDGTHPTDGCGMGCGGQGRLAVIYAPVVDRLLGIK